MKAATLRPNYFTPYRRRATKLRFPNEATRKNFAEQLVDTLLAAAIVLGVVAIMLFLLTLA